MLRVSAGNQLINLGTKIIAIGKNYQAHAIEMGAKHAPKEPVIFLKPCSSYIRQGESIQLPQNIGEVHHELELGVVIGKPGKDISEQNWESFVDGYVMGLDMTARTIQDKAKEQGLPWTQAKCYDTFTPISNFVPKEDVNDMNNLNLWLKVNGDLKQECNTGDMVHKLPFLISYISRIMTLNKGDLILTGTPAGVGPVQAGEVVTAGIEGLVDASFPVEWRL